MAVKKRKRKENIKKQEKEIISFQKTQLLLQIKIDNRFYGNQVKSKNIWLKKTFVLVLNTVVAAVYNTCIPFCVAIREELPKCFSLTN